MSDLRDMQLSVEAVHSGVQAQLWWVPLVRFAVHVSVGTGIFWVVCGASVLLDLLTQRLGEMGVSPIIVGGILLPKYALFGMDILLFLLYLANTSWHFATSLHWRAKDD